MNFDENGIMIVITTYESSDINIYKVEDFSLISVLKEHSSTSFKYLSFV